MAERSQALVMCVIIVLYVMGYILTTYIDIFLQMSIRMSQRQSINSMVMKDGDKGGVGKRGRDAS